MEKCRGLLAVLCMMTAAGCSLEPASRVRPEPARFDYADEIVRGEGFMVLADRREFAVMALLNATGFDEELPGRAMHPVRVRVRELVAAEMAKHPREAEAWRQYIQSRRVAIFQYQDFVLSLSADYPFRRIRPDKELGYPWAAERLQDLPGVLNDFWTTVGLGRIWEAVKPEYIAEIRKYDLERMNREMIFLWKYLRMPRPDAFVITNIPDLLDRHARAIGAHYENYYYSVEGPDAISHGLDAHEYLHSVVNHLVDVSFKTAQAKLRKYYDTGKSGPLCGPYQHPATFVSECLVHALDHRLRVLQSGAPATETRVKGQVAGLSQGGLLLTQPFYHLLSEFEASDKPFDQFLPVLFDRLPECGQSQGSSYSE